LSLLRAPAAAAVDSEAKQQRRKAFFARGPQGLSCALQRASATAPSKAGVVVQDTFKTQLMQLTDKLGAAKAHYIRCIKPNSKKVKPVGVLDLQR
jgi:myosin heavy subunit